MVYVKKNNKKQQQQIIKITDSSLIWY